MIMNINTIVNVSVNRNILVRCNWSRNVVGESQKRGEELN
jgi:hypothetical protein